MTVKRLLFLLLPLSLVMALGCSKSYPNAPASVHGKVTYNGNLVMGGSVTLHFDQQSTDISKPKLNITRPIDKDGIYAATDLPVGECLVTVETESANLKTNARRQNYGGGKIDPAGDYERKMKERMGQAGGGTSSPNVATTTYVKIPSKYANVKTSPLTMTLSKGDQKKNIDLTD